MSIYAAEGAYRDYCWEFVSEVNAGKSIELVKNVDGGDKQKFIQKLVI